MVQFHGWRIVTVRNSPLANEKYLKTQALPPPQYKHFIITLHTLSTETIYKQSFTKVGKVKEMSPNG